MSLCVARVLTFKLKLPFGLAFYSLPVFYCSFTMAKYLPYPKSPRSSIPFCEQIYFLHLSAAISHYVTLQAFYPIVPGVSSHNGMSIHPWFSISFNFFSKSLESRGRLFNGEHFIFFTT